MAIDLTLEMESAFELKIQQSLQKECEELTGINIGIKKFSISAKLDDLTIGGLIAYQHGSILWLDSIYIEQEYQKKALGR